MRIAGMLGGAGRRTHLERTNVAAYFCAVSVRVLVEKVLEYGVLVVELAQGAGHDRLLQRPLWTSQSCTAPHNATDLGERAEEPAGNELRVLVRLLCLRTRRSEQVRRVECARADLGLVADEVSAVWDTACVRMRDERCGRLLHGPPSLPMAAERQGAESNLGLCFHPCHRPPLFTPCSDWALWRSSRPTVASPSPSPWTRRRCGGSWACRRASSCSAASLPGARPRHLHRRF